MLNAKKIVKISKALHATSSLHFLKINNNCIDDNGVESIVTVIGNSPSMKSLDVSGNKMSAFSLKQIITVMSVHNNISVLNFSNNHIVFDEIKNFNFAFAACPTLKELNLSQNLLEFTGVIMIAETLRQHPGLQILQLNNNSISLLSACELLVDVILSTNQSLIYLNVSGRNIRPRFIADHLTPPCIRETHSNFILQNLYLSYYLLLNCISISLDEVSTEVNFMRNDPILVTEKCPFDNCEISSCNVDHNGGAFYNKRHNFSFIIPPGAILQGDCVQIQATASRFGPYLLPDGYYLISSFFWISANYTFSIPVFLILSHHASLRTVTDCNRLHALEACSKKTFAHKEGKFNMNKLPDGVFFDYEIGYCIIATDHFCSYCLVKDDIAIPDEFYASFYTYSFQGKLKAEICICHVNKECIEVLILLSLPW